MTRTDTPGRLHLVIGPVGAGKSTFARRLRADHRAVGFNLDAWMAVLFGADERPAEGVLDWYVERRDRCLAQIWTLACQVVELGTDTVLEIGMIRRDERAAFYQRVDDCGYPLAVYLLDAPREERRERVMRRNRDRGDTFAVEVPPQFFELASDMWESPDDDEFRSRDMRIVIATRGSEGELSWSYDRAADR